MSMDLAVWSENPFEIPAQLPQQKEWKQFRESFCFEGDGWGISVLPAQDSVPKEVLMKLLNAKYVAYVTLEPIGADSEAYKFLEVVVRSLARFTQGVWIDPSNRAYFANEGSFEE